MFLGMEQIIFRFARTGGIETNPTKFIQRANAFASSIPANSSATLLTRREPEGLRGYLILPATSAGTGNPSLHLAHTVGAKAEQVEMPNDLGDTAHIGELIYRASPALRETQAGIDPQELPTLLANTMPMGSWVSVTLRQPSNKERKHYAPWIANRLGTAIPTHHSTTPSSVVISLSAGASTREEVSALLTQVTAELPGFDLETSTRFPAGRSPLFWGLPAGAALVLATLFGLPQIPAEYAAYLPGFMKPALLAAAGLGILAGLAALSGRLPGPETKLRALLAAASFPVPPARTGKPKPPRKESVVRVARTVNGEKVFHDKKVPASDGDYPLARNAFLAGPSVFAGMVSPHAGAVSGLSGVRDRAVPPAMLSRIGPMLGTTPDGPAHLSAAAMLFGVAIVGRPGSGKSLLTRAMFGWHCLERVAPSGLPGHPGRNNTLIAFESKGDGAEKYQGWAAALGDRTLAIEVADPMSRAIDIFSIPGTIGDRASFFVNAMRYSFGNDAIGDRSYETLTQVFTAALAVNDDMLEMMDGRDEDRIPKGGSVMFYAHLLLGGYSDPVGVQLASGIKEVANRLRGRGTPDPNLDRAYEALASLYEQKTESARRSFLEAPRNKVSALLSMDSWWNPARPKVTWDQILTGHHSVVINTGNSTTGIMLDDHQNQLISSLLLYSLQSAIRRLCSGWLEANRFVTLFADELSLLAGHSPEIIGWLRDQGRSYGCRPILATQRPEQLSPLLRNNILTYSTLVSFAQNDVGTANEIAANVGNGNDAWAMEDIMHIEPYHVVVRSEVDQRRMPAFIVQLPNFEANMAGYPASQGWMVGKR